MSNLSEGQARDRMDKPLAVVDGRYTRW